MNNLMPTGRKRIAIALLGTSVVLLAFLLPGLPWSATLGHTMKRVIVKSEMKLARGGVKTPRLMSMAGRLTPPAAKIQALDSRWGWATFADKDGELVLPLEMWYRRARYELLISPEVSGGRLIKETAPEESPEKG